MEEASTIYQKKDLLIQEVSFMKGQKGGPSET